MNRSSRRTAAPWVAILAAALLAPSTTAAPIVIPAAAAAILCDQYGLQCDAYAGEATPCGVSPPVRLFDASPDAIQVSMAGRVLVRGANYTADPCTGNVTKMQGAPFLDFGLPNPYCALADGVYDVPQGYSVVDADGDGVPMVYITYQPYRAGLCSFTIIAGATHEEAMGPDADDEDAGVVSDCQNPNALTPGQPAIDVHDDDGDTYPVLTYRPDYVTFVGPRCDVVVRHGTESVVIAAFDPDDHDAATPANGNVCPAASFTLAPPTSTTVEDQDGDGVPTIRYARQEYDIDGACGLSSHAVAPVDAHFPDANDANPTGTCQTLAGQGVSGYEQQPAVDADRDGLPSYTFRSYNETLNPDCTLQFRAGNSTLGPFGDPDDSYPNGPSTPCPSQIRAQTVQLIDPSHPYPTMMDADSDGYKRLSWPQRTYAFDATCTPIQGGPGSPLVLPTDPNDADPANPQLPHPCTVVQYDRPTAWQTRDNDGDKVPVIVVTGQHHAVNSSCVDVAGTSQDIILGPDPNDADPLNPLPAGLCPSTPIWVPYLPLFTDADQDGIPQIQPREQRYTIGATCAVNASGELRNTPNLIALEPDPDDADPNNPIAHQVCVAMQGHAYTAAEARDEDADTVERLWLQNTTYAVGPSCGITTTATWQDTGIGDPNDHNPNTPVATPDCAVLWFAEPSNVRPEDRDGDGLPAIYYENTNRYVTSSCGLTSSPPVGARLDFPDSDDDDPSRHDCTPYANQGAVEVPTGYTVQDDDQDAYPQYHVAMTDFELDADCNFTRGSTVSFGPGLGDPNDEDPKIPVAGYEDAVCDGPQRPCLLAQRQFNAVCAFTSSDGETAVASTCVRTVSCWSDLSCSVAQENGTTIASYPPPPNNATVDPPPVGNATTPPSGNTTADPGCQTSCGGHASNEHTDSGTPETTGNTPSPALRKDGSTNLWLVAVVAGGWILYAVAKRRRGKR